MSCVNIHVIEAVVNPTLAPTDVGQHWINTATGVMWQSNGTATVANWVKVDADTDVKVKVSSNDTTAGFLNGKLVAGTGVTLTENNDGGNETLTIDSPDIKVKVSSADTTAGFLNDELTVANGTNPTSPLEKSITSPGADEKLQLKFDQTKLVLTASQISNFNEAAQDTIGPAIVAGSGISVNYDDPANTITITNSTISGGNRFWFSGHMLKELGHNVDNAGLTPVWPVELNSAFLNDDTAYKGLSVQAFDDTIIEGIGWHMTIPVGATSMMFFFRSKAKTAPATNKKVSLEMYFRLYADNTDIAAATTFQLNDLTMPANTFIQYDSQTITLATLGLTADRLYLMEMVRDATNANDTLVGDWHLVEIGISFT